MCRLFSHFKSTQKNNPQGYHHMIWSYASTVTTTDQHSCVVLGTCRWLWIWCKHYSLFLFNITDYDYLTRLKERGKDYLSFAIDWLRLFWLYKVVFLVRVVSCAHVRLNTFINQTSSFATEFIHIGFDSSMEYNAFKARLNDLKMAEASALRRGDWKAAKRVSASTAVSYFKSPLLYDPEVRNY